MSQKAKQTQTASRPSGQVVLFGLDDSGKPKAARFSEAQASLATKAAAQLKLQVLSVDDAKLADLAARVPSGRIHANGKGFIPAIRRDLYSKLMEASGQGEPAAAASDSSDRPTSDKPAGKRPSTWQAIAAGHIVIIQDDDPKDGWWEAIVVGASADMLSLRWRANPRQRQIARHRFSVALMYPGPDGSLESSPNGTATNGQPSSKKPGEASESQARATHPRSWTAIASDQLVLAQEDGPLGQWWEAIVVRVQADSFTLRWRGHDAMPPIVRQRFDLALLHPAEK
jgi:hypothetical protein